MNYNRKQFIKMSTAAFAGVTILPHSIFGANNKINLAFVGIGGKGNHAIRTLKSKHKNEVNFVAFSDVDKNHAGKTLKKHSSVPFFDDFRKMMDKHHKNIDGVVISTPDHTHHYITKSCIKMGKAVYTEKPLAHNMREVKELINAEKKYKVICQMGNQGHSNINPYNTKKWIDMGLIGDIKKVISWHNNSRGVSKDELAPKQPVPPGLNWGLWLGPAHFVEYNKAYCPASWRNWFMFGGGTLGDWGCHTMDNAFYSLNLDWPMEIKVESEKAFKYTFPIKGAKLIYTFPASEKHKKITLTWYQGEDKKYRPPRPATFEKERKMGNKAGGSFIFGSKNIIMAGGHGNDARIVPETERKALYKELKASSIRRMESSHYGNWLNAIKGKEKCRSSFAYGGRLTEVVMLGNIALHLNRDLKIDPIKKEIINDPEATALMQGPHVRKGWEM